MKKLILTIVLIISVSFNSDHIDDKSILKTKVQKTYKYEEKFGENVETLTYQGKVDYKYDSENNLIEEVHHTYSNGEYVIDKKYLYKYNSDNNVIEQNIYKLDVNEESWDEEEEFVLDSQDKYEYDSNNLIKISYYDSKGNLDQITLRSFVNWGISSIVMKYDLNGNMIEKTLLDTLGSLKNNRLGVCKLKLKYDLNNNVIERSTFTEDGSLIQKTKSKYDLNNKISEKIEYNSDGNETKKSIYTHGLNKFNQVNYEEGYRVSENISIGDSNDNLLEYIEKSSNETQLKIVQNYNSNNHVTEYIKYVYDYKFDEQNEKIERKIIYEYEYY